MKSTSISIIIAGLLIAGAIYISKNINNGTSTNKINTNNEIVNKNNVSIVDGKQIIEIKAKGGYSPRKSIAKAGIPTILRFNTNGTFDCSASIRISSMNISELLPQSGTKDINIENPKFGTLQGSCGMGMYPFEIEFN